MLSEPPQSDHEKPPPSLPGAARWMIVERARKASARETGPGAQLDWARLVSSEPGSRAREKPARAPSGTGRGWFRGVPTCAGNRGPGYTARAKKPCRIRGGQATPERGNRRGGVEHRPGGESNIRVRSAALRREPDS